jgi:hypothetical protein
MAFIGAVAWIAANDTTQTTGCWIPAGHGWKFLQNKESYEANVGAFLGGN